MKIDTGSGWTSMSTTDEQLVNDILSRLEDVDNMINRLGCTSRDNYDLILGAFSDTLFNISDLERY